jgi:hypothetical protein
MAKSKRTWRDYVKSLSDKQRQKMLMKLLEHYIDEEGSDSCIAYREAEPPEYPDEPPTKECIYWTACGDSLIK